ncbi:MAG: cell wall hydrolase [Rhodospirillales bacterium]|nr:cell wall hydrolase [Rhodospirillales bacterium]
MTRDAHLWMSISIVAASLAWSAVDIHERVAAVAAPSEAPTAIAMAAAAEPIRTVPPAPAAAPADPLAAPAAASPALAEPATVSSEPTADPDPAIARDLSESVAAVLPGASEDPRLDVDVPDAAAAPAIADERVAAADGGDAGDAVRDAPVVADGGDAGDAGDAVRDAPVVADGGAGPEESKDAAGAPSPSVDTQPTVAVGAITITPPQPPRPSGHWARLLGEDIDAELHCLALNIYWEARSEPKLGQFAVAAVTLNRVGHKHFPNTVCGVVSQGEGLGPHRCQFSWMCDGKNNEPRNDKAWREAEHIARSMVYLDLPDPTGGALWYHADYVSPEWATAMAQITQIGRHLFYRAAVRQARSPGGLAG